MQITQLLSWPATNWPTASSAAAQYTVFQIYPGSSPSVVSGLSQVSGTTSATLTYDDSQNLAFQVRPSSGVLPTQTYGPETAVFVVGYVPCRAWLRQHVRTALSDQANASGVTLNWSDDELNGYIQDALIELNILFPVEQDTTVTLLPPTVLGGVSQGVRNYAMSTDFYRIKSVEYITVDGKLHLYLKEKPFIGGESTATSYIGYPKLGILLQPLAGRYFPGHFEVYENTLQLDWDPAGDGDSLHVKYLGKRPFPQNDGDLMIVLPEDMALLSLRVQMSCWLRVEGQDTRLSRWRSKEDGSRRDDMPTVKHSDVIKRLYNELVNDRRELRVRAWRLVRR